MASARKLSRHVCRAQITHEHQNHGERKRSTLGIQLFQHESTCGTCGALPTLWRVRLAAAAAVPADVPAVVAAVGKCKTMCRVFSPRCLVCLSVGGSLFPLPTFSLCISGLTFWPLRPSFRRELLQLLSWLLARLCAFPWRCACWFRRRSGSTMFFTTHQCLRTTSFCFPLPVSLQRFILRSFSLFFPVRSPVHLLSHHLVVFFFFCVFASCRRRKGFPQQKGFQIKLVLDPFFMLFMLRQL